MHFLAAFYGAEEFRGVKVNAMGNTWTIILHRHKKIENEIKLLPIVLPEINLSTSLHTNQFIQL